MVACGGGPPRARKPAEQAVAAPGDIAGRWLASDDLDGTYTLTIGKDGALDLVIERGKLGHCEQHGTLKNTGPNQFEIAYAHDACHRNLGGDLTSAKLQITSFTGDALAIQVVADRIDERQAYRRAPQ